MKYPQPRVSSGQSSKIDRGNHFGKLPINMRPVVLLGVTCLLAVLGSSNGLTCYLCTGTLGFDFCHDPFNSTNVKTCNSTTNVVDPNKETTDILCLKGVINLVNGSTLITQRGCLDKQVQPDSGLITCDTDYCNAASEITITSTLALVAGVLSIANLYL